MTDAFETFWRAYPRRVGKGAARSAFMKAIRKTDIQTMLDAIEAYKLHKPGYQDFCHPSTWLNQERWDDEWEAPQVSTGHVMLDAIMAGRAH
ncbi:hypothetical protein [Mesorhizobium sp. Z1-4]|uniref:hypothetical protein n=1 Tax=Mesorhizobium sp. Z1-4 TaxID=2448478 RepID=UPI000FDBC0CB|nr:hypothetical protein [Mesorhizobium sp. Z1-4]